MFLPYFPTDCAISGQEEEETVLDSSHCAAAFCHTLHPICLRIEIFQWSKVTSSIYNLILGKIYCDHYGTMHIKGNREYSCKLKFKEQSMIDRNPHQLTKEKEMLKESKSKSDELIKLPKKEEINCIMDLPKRWMRP
ncbi:hypothetical protein Scep_004635 [Stephania cephalantha]|uniref:Uncharacterized protein n=1 Tax=Stephania cephalantha TaxID=152367 RepID=A0AAP0KST7_9MAGN